jgi:trans-2-enoyl-CoA reductase
MRARESAEPEGRAYSSGASSDFWPSKAKSSRSTMRKVLLLGPSVGWKLGMRLELPSGSGAAVRGLTHDLSDDRDRDAAHLAAP